MFASHCFLFFVLVCRRRRRQAMLTFVAYSVTGKDIEDKETIQSKRGLDPIGASHWRGFVRGHSSQGFYNKHLSTSLLQRPFGPLFMQDVIIRATLLLSGPVNQALCCLVFVWFVVCFANPLVLCSRKSWDDVFHIKKNENKTPMAHWLICYVFPLDMIVTAPFKMTISHHQCFGGCHRCYIVLDGRGGRFTST